MARWLRPPGPLRGTPEAGRTRQAQGRRGALRGIEGGFGTSAPASKSWKHEDFLGFLGRTCFFWNISGMEWGFLMEKMKDVTRKRGD